VERALAGSLRQNRKPIKSSGKSPVFSAGGEAGLAPIFESMACKLSAAGFVEGMPLRALTVSA